MDELKKLEPIKIQINDAKANSFLDSIKMDRTLMEEVHSLGITDEELPDYLPLLARYQENREAIKKDPDLLVMKLTISDSGKLDFVYVESEKAKKEHALENNYFMRDFPDEWLSASLASKALFKTANQKELKTSLLKTTLSKDKRWFYLYGKLGTGKSFALAAMLNDLASRNEQKVAFINANKRFEELKVLAIREKSKFDEAFNVLSTIDCLVIDDFGLEFKSDYVRDTVVMPLLLERAKNHLFTAFSSDYSLLEIEKLYTTNASSRILSNRLVTLIRNNLESPNGFELKQGFENYLNGF